VCHNGSLTAWFQQQVTGVVMQTHGRCHPAFLSYHPLCAGLVYRGEYMVNWSPRLGTAVSDLEVDYSEEPGHLFFFRWGDRQDLCMFGLLLRVWASASNCLCSCVRLCALFRLYFFFLFNAWYICVDPGKAHRLCKGTQRNPCVTYACVYAVGTPWRTTLMSSCQWLQPAQRPSWETQQ
jgi:hypothetical protein